MSAGKKGAGNLRMPTTADVEVMLKSADGAAQKIERTIASINEAKKLNDQLQAQFAVGTAQWHQCESIDDKLHDALVSLGD